jgi:peptidoglycan/LPS O-acetylase OafA/YrhL
MDIQHTRKTFQQTSPRLNRNNFDLLRLLLAGAVCLYHAASISGFRELAFLERSLSADSAVKAFFVVSGFLIFMSYERSSSLASYASKRAKRIYPAYFTVVVLCAFLLTFISTLDPASYFSQEWLRYVGFNLIFLNFVQPTLPGVFESNMEPFVNGSLWTLKIEVMFYISVPILVFLMRRFNRNGVLAFFYFGGLLYAAVCNYLAREMDQGIFVELGRQLPGQLQYFMAGAFFYYNLPWLERHVRHLGAAALAIIILHQFYSLHVLEPFALATLVICAALFCYLGHFGKYGDFSYGTYILHFPILQTLLASRLFEGSPWSFLASVVALTAVGAWLMWNLVEKKFLGRGSKTRHQAAIVQPS